jgi:hypothetical protein
MKITSLLFGASFFLIFACDNPSNDDPDFKSNNRSVSASDNDNPINDPFFLRGARIEGDLLLIDVQYAGGCENHSFTLEWPEIIIAIYPPQFGVLLYHDSNDDMCEALISETLEFQLSDNTMDMSIDDLKVAKITVINQSNTDEVVVID